MAELVNGDGTIPQATGGWVQKLISSSTNTSPITVTFCSAHCSNEGDTWGIEGHQVNTNANGNWRVHVTGTQTLQLVGSTGNGVGGLTGYGIDYSVNPLIQVANDLEAASASNSNTPIEALANVVPYLYKRAGKYSLYDFQVITAAGQTLANPTGTSWGSATSLTSGTWTAITGTSATYPNAIQTGDILVIELGAQDFSIAANVFGVAIGAAINGGATQILGSFDSTGLPSWFTGNTFAVVRAAYVGLVKSSATPIKAGGLALSAMGAQNTGGPVNMTLGAPYWIKVTHYRSNA